MLYRCSQESWKFGSSALEMFCPMVTSIGDFVVGAEVTRLISAFHSPLNQFYRDSRHHI